MKKSVFWFGLLLQLIIAVPLIAGEVTLQWNANSESDLNGYNVYYGKTSRQYGSPISVGKTTTHTVTNLDDGASYYFSLTAVDTSGNESGYSSEIKATAKTGSSGGDTGDKVTIAMWWTAYNTRPTAAPVQIYDGTSLLATVKVNQRENGGKWNTLGAYTFKNKPRVVIVAENNGSSTCADAVKITGPDGSSLIMDNGQTGTSNSGTWLNSGGTAPYGGNSLYSKSGSYTFDTAGGSVTPPATAATTVAMWWTAYNTRPTAAPVQIYDGSSLLATVKVNQRENGGKWNTLGSYTFKNSPRVVIVAESNGSSTCADAVKITNPDGSSTIVDNDQTGTSKSGTWLTSGGTAAYGANSLYSKSGYYAFDVN